MATTALTLAAERWLDEVVLVGLGPADALGAALSEIFSLPAGLGDIALMSVHFRGSTIDVGPAAASTVPRGIRAMIISADASTVVDTIGVAPWYLTFDTATTLEYQAMIDPDALTLWRQNELMSVTSPELDSDATPTGDLRVFVKAVRVRPIETPVGALQLVR